VTGDAFHETDAELAKLKDQVGEPRQAGPPASTTIGVPQLARPGAVFEIEAIAVLPPK
jgi:enamine deaminase RidA (YjgF/YER057c/UK114 family)